MELSAQHLQIISFDRSRVDIRNVVSFFHDCTSMGGISSFSNFHSSELWIWLKPPPIQCTNIPHHHFQGSQDHNSLTAHPVAVPRPMVANAAASIVWIFFAPPPFFEPLLEVLRD